MPHKKVKVDIGGYEVDIDKGIEDIISNLFFWGFSTTNSCINNNGNVWIEFEFVSDVEIMMQMILKHNLQINHTKYVRDTLWDFLTEGRNSEFTIVFTEEVIPDPRDEDCVIGTGRVESGVSLRFPKKNLNTFKRLFFEVFPPQKKKRKNKTS